MNIKELLAVPPKAEDAIRVVTRMEQYYISIQKLYDAGASGTYIIDMSGDEAGELEARGFKSKKDETTANGIGGYLPNEFIETEDLYNME